MARERTRAGKPDRAGGGLFYRGFRHRRGRARVASSRSRSAAISGSADRSSRRRVGFGGAHQRHREGSLDEGIGTFEVGEEESGASSETEYEVVPLPVGKVCYKRRP